MNLRRRRPPRRAGPSSEGAYPARLARSLHQASLPSQPMNPAMTPMKAFRFPNDEDNAVWAGTDAHDAARAAYETTGEKYDADEAEELTEAELDAEVVFEGEPSDPVASSTLRAELAQMTEAGFLAGRDA